MLKHNFVLLPLVFAMLSCSCGAATEQPSPGASVAMGNHGNMAATDDAASKEITKTLLNYQHENSGDKGEELGIALGNQFAKWPKQFVEQSVLVGYSDRQIANFIVMLPVSFIDEACQSSQELTHRQKLLLSVEKYKERVLAISALVKESIERDLKHCSK